jgi:hypothetical protein
MKCVQMLLGKHFRCICEMHIYAEFASLPNADHFLCCGYSKEMLIITVLQTRVKLMFCFRSGVLCIRYPLRNLENDYFHGIFLFVFPTVSIL